MANTIPVASDVEAESFEDGIVFITLTASDAEDGGDIPPQFTLSSLPAHGALYATDPLVDPAPQPAQAGTAYAADGWSYDSASNTWSRTFFFVPTPDWSGTTTFDYMVTDSADADSAPATATIARCSGKAPTGTR